MITNTNSIFSKVFIWLFIGLALAFGSGYVVSNNETMMQNLFGGPGFWVVIIVQFGAAIFLGARIHKMSLMTAAVTYLLFTLMMGFTLSGIFVIYEMESIIWVFAITSVTCLIFGLFGYFTDIDLTKIGSILFMGLIALIIAQIANIFIKSETFDIVLCMIGIVVFLIYVAYDIQKIKLQLSTVENKEAMAVYGAFRLFLDFINVFIRILRLMGKRR